MIRKLSKLRAAANRPPGYVSDVLSGAVVNEAADTYEVSDEHWAAMVAKYRPKEDSQNYAVPQKRAIEWPIRGPKMWSEFHSRSSVYAGDTATELNWLSWFAARIGCGDCKKHWLEWVKANPPDLSSAAAYRAWGVMAHNDVNMRLGKPVWNV